MENIKIKTVLFTSKKYADGTSPIMIRITNNRKTRYISTGYSAKTEHWDDDEHKLIESRSKDKPGKKPLVNARAVNNDIGLKVSVVIDAKQKLTYQGTRASAANIKSQVFSNGFDEVDFFNYANKRVKQLEDGQQFRTYKRYKSVVDRMQEYIKKPGFSFDDLNVEFLNDYMVHLKKQNYHINSVYSVFKTIRAIVSTAIEEGKLPPEKNPFIRFKFKSVKTVKEKLSWEELISIEKLKLKKDTKPWHCRNYFMFSFYNAGIRAGDLIQLKWENIRDGRLIYEMNKTNRNKSIRLQNQAIKILKFYKNRKTKPSDYIFQLLKNDEDYSNKRLLYNQISSQNAIINKHLKTIAELAKIKKPLSFHISRHSFSDLARKKGASIYDISKALGHSNTKITETYLASFDEESLDNTMDSIFKSTPKKK